MNQYEEFNNYYLLSSKDDLNPYYLEEPRDEEEVEEEGNNIINIEEKKEKPKKVRFKISTSKKLKSTPSRYHTYTLDYKRQVIAQVIQILIIIFIFDRSNLLMTKKK